MAFVLDKPKPLLQLIRRASLPVCLSPIKTVSNPFLYTAQSGRTICLLLGVVTDNRWSGGQSFLVGVATPPQARHVGTKLAAFELIAAFFSGCY